MSIVVVGGSSGLGAALAMHYDRRGDRVVATGRRIDRIQPHLRNGGTTKLVRNDLCSLDAVSMLEPYCRSADIIYYCAAVADPHPIRLIFRVNLEAFVELSKTIDRKGLTIVAISSLAAVVPFENIPAYCASKAALETWIEASRKSMLSRIVIARPGQFSSELFEKADAFDPTCVPSELAARLAEDVLTRRRLYYGGPRDRAAGIGAHILGGHRSRRWFLGF